MKPSIYLSAAILLIAVSGGCGYRSSSPSGVATSYFRHIERGEIEEAAALLSSAYVNGHGGPPKVKSELAEMSRELKAKGGLKSLEVMKEETFGDLADVTIKATLPDGRETTGTVKLIKEDGAWKMESK